MPGAAYLFADLSENKFGDRSTAIGKRFGRLKTDAGFGREKVFHSIRKSFANATLKRQEPSQKIKPLPTP